MAALFLALVLLAEPDGAMHGVPPGACTADLRHCNPPREPAVVDELERVSDALIRLERLDAAARALDEAEVQLAAARSQREKRAAWRAWLRARAELRREATRR